MLAYIVIIKNGLIELKEVFMSNSQVKIDFGIVGLESIKVLVEKNCPVELI